MANLTKSESGIEKSDKHIPQIGDHYFYNSRGYETIIRIERIEGNDFVVSELQKDGTYKESKFKKNISSLDEYYLFLPDFEEENNLADKLLDGSLVFKKEQELQDTRSIAKQIGVESLLKMERHCIESAEKYKMISRIAEAKIRAIRNSLDEKVDALKSYCEGLYKQVSRIREALSLIDLYTGKSIEVSVLKEGKTASQEEPFCIRQQLLYMDEECRITYNDGIDATSIQDFIDWLVSDDRNIEQVIPERKAVVAIKPRRAPAKDYNDSHYNAQVEKWNKYTYFLFRNGDNIYSVDSEDFQVYGRLIPSKEDMAKLKKDIEEAARWNKDPNEVCEKFNLRFYRFMMFLQGVLNSTDILKPMPDGINLLDESTYKEWIRIIYDDENVLTDGRPTYNEWIGEINSQVCVGSRIIYVADAGRSWTRGKSAKQCWGEEHLLRYYRNEYSMPMLPQVGVYTLKQVDLNYKNGYALTVNGDDTKALGFLYEDERERWWYEKDKAKRKKVTCLLCKFDNFINYDMLSIEDIEYYLSNRIYRTQYLELVPVLLNARRQLREEKRQEEAFRDMIINYSGKNITPQEVDDAIEWWKMKNKYKRPISNDCAKAMRMIRRKLGIE